jgi:hypothetical protein
MAALQDPPSMSLDDVVFRSSHYPTQLIGNNPAEHSILPEVFPRRLLLSLILFNFSLLRISLQSLRNDNISLTQLDFLRVQAALAGSHSKMAPNLLPFGPTEIIIRVLQSCDDFYQVFALVSTCKHLRSVWQLHSPTIIWHLGVRSMPAFDDALMAVSYYYCLCLVS